MSEPADAPTDVLEGTDRALRRAGLRATQQRRTILAALMQSDDHPTADELLARTRALDETVSFATVYRTLGALEAGWGHRDMGVYMTALDSGRGVLELVRAEQLLDDTTLADILRPENMIAPRLVPLQG